jgi:hypothetical protein
MGTQRRLSPIIHEALERYLTPQRDSWRISGRHLAATTGEHRGKN